MDKEKSKVLPYDFIKENQVIASETADGYEVISPTKITPTIYHELYKYLKKDFTLNICSSDKFNELLTNTFTIDDASNDISEELSDEFDLQSFAGSISATEDLLSGGDDTPIIKLINGVISQAIKNRA
ncbi:MAG: type II/IV secretion system protein, partial [Proteobacteria bacterium]|nr:type II/IV secretion system protein [Pseudomonadota bacterium]